MKIVVVGTGYVGLVTGTCFAESGHEVACVDVDVEKIATLRAGGIPIYEPGLGELVRRNVAEGRLSFTTSLEEAMRETAVAFIAVGTPPSENGEADLSHVLDAAEQIGRAIDRYVVVVNKSTVPVGSAEKVAEAIRRVKPDADFDVVSNPEFLKEGTAVDDFMRPDRVVVGTSSDRARAVMAELYGPFVRVEQPILFMDERSAELTKYAANAMLAARISFVNDVAALCERLGADVDHVRRGMGSDKRIGHSFLFPGVGFGGSCLAGGETVLARQDGRARLVELGVLFDVLAIAAETAVAPSAALRPEGLEVLAWRPGSARAEFLPVAFVTRRPFAGEAVEVRTKMGRRLLCTPDHPFVVTGTSGERFAVKPAQDLGTDDWLPLVPAFEAGARSQFPLALDVLQSGEVDRKAFAGPVYSLEVPGAHTFVASGGLVAHNCFPKDVRAMMTMARSVGLDFDLLRSVERVNERQKRWMVEKALKHFGSFAGKTFGVWGLAFKPKTDDMREAPAITVVEGLVGNGARVRAHDPVAGETARRLFHDRIEIVKEPYAAAEGADALFLVTEWNEFRQLDLARLKRSMRTPVLFDGRNVWDARRARAAGFTYYGVGRGNDPPG